MRTQKKIILFLAFLLAAQAASAQWVKYDAKTFAWLRSVYFVSESRGWIVGSQGVVLESFDGGKSWKAKPKFTSDNIIDVYFQDEKNGWLLCERDIYNSGSNSPSYLLKTSDGGQTWEKMEFGGGKERMARFFFSKDGAGAALGEAGILYELQGDGKTWKKKQLPVKYLMLDGAFQSSLRYCISGGGGTILYTEDGGASWNLASILSKAEGKLNALFFANQKQGWAAGSGGKILTTSNGGKLWREQASGSSSDLHDIFFLNTAEGWAIGKEGALLYTSTGGNAWRKEKLATNHKLERIFFFGRKGWIVGFGGAIFQKPA